MVVNNVSQNYKVFVMPSDEHRGSRRYEYVPFMVVYDSITTQWWSSTDPPFFDEPDEPEVNIDARCSVFYDGLQYILMLREIETEHRNEDYTDFWL